jgi:hypothetical protein
LKQDFLSTELLAALIHLVAMSVKYIDTFTDEPGMSKEHKHAARALPDLLNKFAAGCRADGGERMKKRILRHSLHSKTLPLDCGGEGEIILYDGRIGMKICHNVSPSYKSGHYDTVCVFNAEDLLACADTCKAGPQGHDKHACVHVPVLPFCFSLLVMDGLAEHLLYELQAFDARIDGK